MTSPFFYVKFVLRLMQKEGIIYPHIWYTKGKQTIPVTISYFLIIFLHIMVLYDFPFLQSLSFILLEYLQIFIKRIILIPAYLLLVHMPRFTHILNHYICYKDSARQILDLGYCTCTFLVYHQSYNFICSMFFTLLYTSPCQNVSFIFFRGNIYVFFVSSKIICSLVIHDSMFLVPVLSSSFPFCNPIHCLTSHYCHYNIIHPILQLL